MRRALCMLSCALTLCSLSAAEDKALPGLPGAFTWFFSGTPDAELGPEREMTFTPASVIFLPYSAEMMQSKTFSDKLIEPGHEKLLLVLRQPGEPRMLPPAGSLGDTAIRTVDAAWDELPTDAAALDSFDCIVALSPGARKEGPVTLAEYLASGGKVVMGLAGARTLFAAMNPTALSLHEYVPVVEDAAGTGVAWEGAYPGGFGRVLMVNTARLEEADAGDLASKVSSAIGEFIASPVKRAIIPAANGRIDKALYDAAEPLLNASDTGRTVYVLALLTLILVAITGLVGYAKSRKASAAAVAILAVVFVGIVMALPPRSGRVVRVTILKMTTAGQKTQAAQIEILTGVKVFSTEAVVTVESAAPTRPLVYNIEEVLETPYHAAFSPDGTELDLKVLGMRPIIFYSCTTNTDSFATFDAGANLIPAREALQTENAAVRKLLNEIISRLPGDGEVFVARGGVVKEDIVKVSVDGRNPGAGADIAIVLFPGKVVVGGGKP